MRVGVIGLGRMGAAMAASLLKAGHQVTVFNRTPARMTALVAQGAIAADSIRAASRGDAVMTMLADDAALEEVALGADGILESLPAGALHVSASTVSVTLTDRLAERHAAAGQGFVAAPVFGRPEAAAPLLAAVGQRTYRVSETPRLASLVKLSGNFLIAAVIESLGEALALVVKGGMDPHQYMDLLTSSLFDVPLYRTYGELIAGERFEPAGFAAPLGHKDLRLALAAAEELRVPLPFAGVLHDRLLSLLARGGEALDWSAIGRLAALDAGLAGAPGLAAAGGHEGRVHATSDRHE